MDADQLAQLAALARVLRNRIPIYRVIVEPGVETPIAIIYRGMCVVSPNPTPTTDKEHR